MLARVHRRPASAWAWCSRRSRPPCWRTCARTTRRRPVGTNSTLREIGVALGIAVLTAVFTGAGGQLTPTGYVDAAIPAVFVGAGVLGARRDRRARRSRRASVAAARRGPAPRPESVASPPLRDRAAGDGQVAARETCSVRSASAVHARRHANRRHRSGRGRRNARRAARSGRPRRRGDRARGAPRGDPGGRAPARRRVGRAHRASGQAAETLASASELVFSAPRRRMRRPRSRERAP